jgi:hypothetical protein
MTPNYSTEYDTLDFEDLQSLSDPLSAYNISTSLSPPAFDLPSPISDFPSLGVEDLFDEKLLLNLWAVPTAFNNNTINPTASGTNPSGENSHTGKIHDWASSSSASSESSSPRAIEDDIEKKKPIKRVRKHPSEDCRAKSPGSIGHKPHNLIEKKYRNNLNSKIMCLRDSIQNRHPMNENKDGGNALDSDAGESKKVPKWSKVRAVFSFGIFSTFLQRTSCSLMSTLLP